MVKIIFFDIDGTLVQLGTTKLSTKTKEALLACRQKGIKIFLATGRPNFVIPEFDIEFDGVVSFNGQYCYNQSQVIYENSLNPCEVLQVKQNCDKLNKPLAIATKHKLCSNYYEDLLDYYFTFASQNLEVDQNFDETIKEPVFQMMVSTDSSLDKQLLHNCHSLQITRWWDKACDIIPLHGGKEIGIQHVLDYYGFSIDESMSFGDGGNDASMIMYTGIGIAMGNAKDEVKQVSDYVTLDVKDDGIYHALKHFDII
ncbi:Cof-type HAD-IIB family hydrolase [Floccifex sp.]|uniref:Cof-type HAD-IIB family hydrolase n=1 Tax=Floccifex sp. TaxID=2815810 RepID=UPI002A76564F|nr:Cof-type HAD-IIB family hydrolase [Floccifex sp.]MDD7281613.1 Cof-type HAD-IIB family hydrolase [Erysipelotrichaceae bacterium]MDY2958480.1 Cof-type HAD-IIB family hydrolase [Floccifex sp.]